jgi:integrase
MQVAAAFARLEFFTTTFILLERKDFMQPNNQPNRKSAPTGKVMPPQKIKASIPQWRPQKTSRTELARETENDNAALVLLQAAQRYPNDRWGQFSFLLREYRIPASQGRARSVSSATVERYGETIAALLHTLEQLNMAPRNLFELSIKNFRRAMSQWEESGLSASTLSNRYSIVKRLYRWLGKSDNFPTLKEMLVDPANGVRNFSAQVPKSWMECGVDPAHAIAAVTDLCKVTGIMLRFELLFGLRSAEALHLRPHECDARFDKVNPRPMLHLTKGTKNGLIRDVPIETQAQIDLLEEAKLMTNSRTGLLGRYGHNYTRARNHYYYILRRAGITRKAMGVTAHGLRHAYVNAAFKELTGADAPVAGGRHLDHANEVAARAIISRRIGHTRPGITTAYAGSMRNITVLQRRNLDRLLASFSDNEALQREVAATNSKLEEAGLSLCIYVYGREAEGRAVPPGVPLSMSLELQPLTAGAQIAGEVFDVHVAEVMRGLQDALNAAAGRTCAIIDARSLDAAQPTVLVVG